MAIDHIQRLYNERSSNSLWCKSQLHTANFASGCLQGRFFYELFQNTDDAGGTKLTCSLKEKTLTVTHNGRHFNQDDVDKIVDFANQEIRTKSKNSKMTGYKGIGFKALLSMATRVHIISGRYSFRFDQNHWKEPMPWEMIPIWTERRNIPFDDKVRFIFDLHHPEIFVQRAEAFLKEPNPLLFLRNLKIVQFFMPNKVNCARRQDLKLSRQLQAGGKVKSEWVIKSTPPIEIPPEIQEVFQESNSTVCPDRLKEAKTVDLQFAFFYPKRRFAEISSSLEVTVFNTLPTKVRPDWPFAVNTEFLVDAQREQLLDHVWNEFLFEQIADFQFYFIQEFAKENQWHLILNLLGPIIITTVDKKFAKAYKKGFEKGLNKFAWIPSFHNPHQLLKLKDCTIDPLKFYITFKDDLDPHQIPSSLAHPEMDQFGKLTELCKTFYPSGCLEEETIFDKLENIFQEKQDPDLCYRILVFFKDRLESWGNLKEKNWIPTVQGSLGQLSNIFISLDPQDCQPPDFLDILIMDPCIFEHDENQELQRFLHRQGIHDLSAKHLISHSIASFIASGKVTEDNTLQLISYLFQLYSDGQIDEHDLKHLQNMPVLNVNNTLAPIGKLYLSKEYQIDESYELEKLFPNKPELFLHPIYSQNHEDSLASLREFFQALGVQEKCELVFLDKTTIKELKKQNISYLNDFLDYLYTEDKKIFSRGIQDKDVYKSFFFFPMMEHLPKSSFANQFWQALKERGPQFIRQDTACHCVDGKNTKRTFSEYKKDSYIKFVLNSFDCIQGTDGNFYQADQLYSPAFKEFHLEELIAADISIDLDEKLIEYLGFKTTVLPRECFHLLNKMHEDTIQNLPLYTTLITNLLSSWDHLDDDAQTTLLGNDWYFLAHNNTWQSVSSLKCFAISGATPSLQSSRWFKHLPSVDMECLANIFNRPIVRESVVESEIENPQKDHTLRQTLIRKLPLIAWKRAHQLMKSDEEVLEGLADRLVQLEIYETKMIPPAEENSVFFDIISIGNKIYYTSKCSEPKLYGTIAQLLHFNPEEIKDFIEILSLKTERSTRQRKTEADWIRENQIPKERLDHLEAYLENHQVSLCEPPSLPLATNTPVRPSHLPAPSLTPSQTKADDQRENDMQVDQSPIAPRSASRKLNYSQDKNKDDPLHVSVPSDEENEHSENSEATPNVWTPRARVEKISARKEKISKLALPQFHLNGDATASSASSQFINPQGQQNSRIRGSNGNSSSFQDSTLSKTAVGHWGESFALKNLIEHYVIKYHASSNKITQGHFKLTSELCNLEIEWINRQKESGQPYDLLLTKQKNGKSYQRTIEIKATRGNQIHFYLSEHEWNKLHENPKNRLYLVQKAGTRAATIQKIPNPQEWLKQANPIVHPTYEIKV